MTAIPNGVGLGLRWEFLEEVLEGPDLPIAFFEVSPENYMRRGGYYPAALERIGKRYPIVSHGLTLSLGALDPPEPPYLSELRDELARLDTPWHSDHLALTSAGVRSFHELLPIRFAHDTVARVADRLAATTDALRRPVAFENITYYAALGVPELSEADFICALCEQSPAKLLLDVNNVYVNGVNHGQNPRDVIAQLPLDRVVEIHVAGHARSSSGLVIDTHGTPVIEPVLDLLEWTLERTGPLPVLLERDNDVPPLAELLTELAELQRIFTRATARSKASRGGSHASHA